MLRAFEGISPTLKAGAWVDQAALVIGDVVLGSEVSVWPMTVIRGDVNYIRIGARTNVQDGTIVHVAHAGGMNPEGFPTLVGEDVTIGHNAVIHACTIGDRCLIGMSATVMDGAVLEDEVIVGAGSMVPPGKHLRAGHLYIGSPAREKRPLTEDEKVFLRYSAAHYVELAARHQR
ncbi:gamma carbonic anhydrase family protein [Methylonatrum kenyense]|uniref:gamma carbonic anhydrase family protein n=1 Tax=Methylonatrum kenyense TaxID=455253 RepID=UPI0020BD5F3E|nr:gamma carbonic anhydrase family protein [Methylonatrum kenyense]MCK8515152.1 gamma carbonic anhydrase family protein [Methylonatrum kenyense]